MFKRLRHFNLYAKLLKYKFIITQVNFLRFIVNINDVIMKLSCVIIIIK